METKNYSIVKNFLWPFKTSIEIGPESISTNGKSVKWKEIDHFVCHIQSVNKGMNYIIAITDKNKKSVSINMVHNIFASKSKKEQFAEIYSRTLENITNQHIFPKVKDMVQEISNDKELAIAGVIVSKDKVEITKGLMKKEKTTFPINDVEQVIYEGTGGFRISSKTNEKDFQHIPFAGLESRYLFEVIKNLI